MWIGRKAGRIRTVDIAMLLFWFWCTLSLIVVYGMEQSIQTPGILFIETLGPYFLARCYIRDAEDFYNMIQLLFRIVLFLLPFAVFEFFSAQNISRELFATIFPIIPIDSPMPARMGLTRVQSVFDHPILFGMFTGSILPLVYLVLGYKKGLFQRSFWTGLVAAVSFMSLSAGPLTQIVTAGFLLSWNGLLGATKARWKILIVLVVLITLATELFANRSVLTIVVSFFLLDPISYWGRLMIFEVAWASVSKHPLFGVGHEWERPEWMGDSIDNFWLLLAVRYGLPASVLLLLALLSIFLAVSFKKGLDDRLTVYRTAFLITMTSLFVVSWTVHLWDAAYVLFLFLLGSGVWMLDMEPKESAALHARV